MTSKSLKQWLIEQSKHSNGQVRLSLIALWTLTGVWTLFWPVPTEVTGRGVMTIPGSATLIDSRGEGQIRNLNVSVGDAVRAGDVLMVLDQPGLATQLERQKRNLRELIQINADLDQQDTKRLDDARAVRDTALVKLQREQAQLERLQATYAQKVADFDHLARRDVVAPLAKEVIATSDRNTQLQVELETLAIKRKDVSNAFSKVQLAIDTEQQQRRFRIDNLRREIDVSAAELRYQSELLAKRDGTVIDLQVIPGQTVKPGQRLGTISSTSSQRLEAVAYFHPADARRLQPGLGVEVVPDWQQRGRFGGIRGSVSNVSLLPATPEDINTTIGNPPLAKSLVSKGPVIRTEIDLSTSDTSFDGFSWTLSQGSNVFPIREGLTLQAHSYVEWRTPLSYLLPVLRDLTGTYRTPGLDQQQDRPDRRQKETLP
ncbi:MAG: NHLP bacteriocin system secretion protein [Synechococcus sp. BS307-5m-G39]|nr:NHLP bacteriocin system secretion protein [Synechococcus sp. BS307-5m-G39]MBL6801411.1 NHLP bacteriocin system secretion protein [Synechococcus sp. BS307-5m-G37]